MHTPRTEALLRDGLEAGEYPGAQLSWSAPGRTGDLVLGHAGRAPEAALTSGTEMAWLSAGKPLTAVAWARLWETGRVGLDDRVAEHVPEFGVRGKEGVTLRHVLTHTAGFRSLFDLDGDADSWEAALERVCASRLERDWVPGRRAGYQARSGWLVLGEVLQRVTRQSLASWVRQAVLEPCGMSATRLCDDEPPRGAGLYDTRAEVGGETGGGPAVRVGDLRCCPGAGARGPAADLRRFYEALLRGGVGPAGVRVLQGPTVEALTARHRAGLHDASFAHVVDWGLGFVLDSKQHGADTVPYGYGDRASPRTFGHAGSQCSVGLGDPEHGLAAALIVNGRPGESVHRRRFRAVLTALYEDLSLGDGAVGTR